MLLNSFKDKNGNLQLINLSAYSRYRNLAIRTEVVKTPSLSHETIPLKALRNFVPSYLFNYFQDFQNYINPL
jgi:hypothetical protein